MNQLHSRLLFGLGALLLLIAYTRSGNGKDNEKDFLTEYTDAVKRGEQLAQPILDGMMSEDMKEREAAYIAWETANNRVITALLDIAKTKKERYDRRSDSRAMAVEMLGKMRVREAIPILLDDLDWHKQGTGSVLHDSPFNHYHCAEALHQIGTEAVPRMLWYMQAPRSDKKIELAAHILLDLYDHQEAGARESEFIVRRFAERRNVDLKRLEAKIKGLRKNWTANETYPEE